MSRKVYQAKYFQENKDKILAKRKTKKHKEKEAGLTSLFSESAAVPPQVQQQTVSSCEEANELSISNVEELFPLKAETETGYAIAGGMEPAEFGAGASIFSAVDRRRGEL